MTLFEVLRIVLEVFYNRFVMYAIIGSLIANHDVNLTDHVQQAVLLRIREILNSTNSTSIKNITSTLTNILKNATDIPKIIPAELLN